MMPSRRLLVIGPDDSSPALLLSHLLLSAGPFSVEKMRWSDLVNEEVLRSQAHLISGGGHANAFASDAPSKTQQKQPNLGRQVDAKIKRRELAWSPTPATSTRKWLRGAAMHRSRQPDPAVSVQPCRRTGSMSYWSNSIPRFGRWFDSHRPLQSSCFLLTT